MASVLSLLLDPPMSAALGLAAHCRAWRKFCELEADSERFVWRAQKVARASAIRSRWIRVNVVASQVELLVCLLAVSTYFPAPGWLLSSRSSST